ncbi:M18 family aminopeptidase [uncultured Muribaculum sp.]|uniref:M18 family aminopeptidase n=1 Tax=uncultured Muribaculum sp. TaxID=1918613 RepID=UPI00259248C3|nr:M18 family aminopeptidase [uncultured Muribaculum sp.]
MEQYDSSVNGLMNFLDASVCNFFAVDTLSQILVEEGFVYLDPKKRWELVSGGKYFITKNDSALFAFIVGEGTASDGYKIISAHSDSPGFRIKPNCEIVCDGNIVKLNTEVYGGPILYTWFDRPLSIAGRVIVRGTNPLAPETLLVKWDEPLLTIPHLAIHFNRSVNEGNPLSKQKDMLPVLGKVEEKSQAKGLVLNMVAGKLGIRPDDILDYDLSLYDTTKASLVGLNEEFITSGRLDDLSMAHAAVNALLESEEGMKMTKVMAIFDNEETGSGTKQGAASPVLMNLLKRINSQLGGDEEDYLRAIDNSFMISADNAHGVHPNYVEKQDPTNHPVLGGGPVIKINANCKYMTDADSAAVFKTVCEKADVPCQYFVNHSDVAGGSTLGNILTSQIDLRGVDMGAALWAMHSVRETASVADHLATIKAFTKFYDL